MIAAVRPGAVLNNRKSSAVSETTSSRLLTLLSLLQGRRDGRAPSSPTGWRSPRAPSAATSSGCARSAIRSSRYRPGRRLPAARGRRDAAAAARRRRGDRDRGRPAHRGRRRRWPGSRRPRCARWSSSSRCCPRTCAAASRRSAARPRRCRSTAARGRPACLTVLAAAVRDHERVRFAYTARDRAGTPPRGRAARAGQRRPPLVPGRLGLRPQRLAHVPRRPDRKATSSGVRFTRAAAGGDAAATSSSRCVLPLALRGARDDRVPAADLQSRRWLGGEVDLGEAAARSAPSDDNLDWLAMRIAMIPRPYTSTGRRS